MRRGLCVHSGVLTHAALNLLNCAMGGEDLDAEDEDLDEADESTSEVDGETDLDAEEATDSESLSGVGASACSPSPSSTSMIAALSS